MTDNISNLIKNSLDVSNNWRQTLLSLLKLKDFPSMIYTTFFLLSPSSLSKFKNIQKQSVVLAGALKIILADDYKNLEKSSNTKKLIKRMKRVHKRYKVGENEFECMKMGILIAALYFLHKGGDDVKFDSFKKGFNQRMYSIKDLVIAKNITLDGSISSSSTK